MILITALVSTDGLLHWEEWPYEDGARVEFQYLSTRIGADEAAFLLEAMPPASVSADTVCEWLDQAIDLLPHGAQAGISVIAACEGPQYRRVTRLKESA